MTGFFTHAARKYKNILISLGIVFAFVCKSYVGAALIRNPHVWSIEASYHSIFYFLDYSHGFIPRGLIGSLFTRLCPGACSGDLFFALVFFGFEIILSIAVIMALTSIFAESGQEKRLWLILVLLWAYFNPNTFLFFCDDFPRLDLFIVSLTVLYGLFRMFSGKIVFLLPVVAVVCTAIHEASIFLYIPILLLISFLPYDFSDRRQIRTALCITMVTVIVCILVVIVGKMNFSHEKIIQIVQSNIAGTGLRKWEGVTGQVGLYSRFTYWEHIKNLLGGSGFPPLFYLEMITTVFFFTFGYFFIWRVWYKLWIAAIGKTEKIRLLAGLVLSLCPLSLCLLGCDYGRWFAAFTYSQYAIFFILIPECSGRMLLERKDFILWLANCVLFNAVGNAQGVSANTMISIISTNLLKLFSAF